jgi:hypothetical protein
MQKILFIIVATGLFFLGGYLLLPVLSSMAGHPPGFPKTPISFLGAVVCSIIGIKLVKKGMKQKEDPKNVERKEQT